MKKQIKQHKKKIAAHTYVWSLFFVSIFAYCGTIGMITFDVVGRKSLNQEAQKIAALVAKQEELFLEKTKSLSLGITPAMQAHVVAYIDSREGAAVGFAQ
jgi:hypothetical protein